MKLPPGFHDLAAAYQLPDRTCVDVIGVVTDMMPVTTARSGQYTMTFSLLDESFQDSFPGLPGFPVRFFDEDVTRLPKLGGRGDVALLRSVRIMSPSGRKTALNSRGTATLIFHSAAIPSPEFRITANDKNKIDCHGTPADIARLSLTEQAYVIDIKSSMSSTIANLSPIKTVPKRTDANTNQALASKRPKLSTSSTSGTTAFGPKFRLISQLRHMLYADIVGQVVKRFATPYGNCDLYVTDYTENKEMFHYPAPEEEGEVARDGDTFGYSGPQKRTWPGPYGSLVLKINLKPPHSTFANTNIEAGDFVLLRNVKCKVYDLRLEGDMWPDSRYPDRIQIQKLRKDERHAIPDLKQRKDQYWSARMRVNANNVAGKDESKLLGSGNTNSSKGKLKDRKKNKRPIDALVDPRTIETPENGAVSGSKNVGASNINRHVRCSHEDVRIVSVKDILDPDNVRHSGVSPSGQDFIAPFVNAKYRARVRVVDYEPKDLEEFSIPSTYLDDDNDDASDSMAWVSEDSQRYKWCFRLLLEDSNAKTHAPAEHDRVWVHVGHEQAQFLFGNGMDDPKDLRLDTRQLANLRERLFVLWGNLEECGGQGLSNLSFECCIMEHGIETGDKDAPKQRLASGWSRIYSIFGTTIM